MEAVTPRRQPVAFRPPGRRAGWRYERLWFVLAGLTAAVAAGVQASSKFTGAPLWVPLSLVVFAAVLAVATALVKLRSTGTAEERKWVEQVQQLLAVPPTEDGQLRRLSTLSPYRLGVSPTRYGYEEQRGSDPYVRRTADDELDRALRDKPFVLVVGDSKAGKSRTAYEAARRVWWNRRPHDPRVLVPKGAVALGQLLDLDPPLDLRPLPALLWLDDLTEGGLGELSGVLLDRLQYQQVRILATITAQRYGRIEASDTEIGRTARQALDRATVVLLDSELTEAERAAAEAAYPTETFEAGIGEQLVAAGKLATRYDTARRGGEPHGWAVVQAAIDWVRMDIGRPIRRSELTALYPLYLRQVRPTDEPRSDLGEPLEWARTAVGSRIALLRPSTDDAEASYLPFDYLVGLADGQHGRDALLIPDDTWNQVARLATPAERSRASTSAYYRRLPGPARTLLLSVIESDDPDLAPLAMFNLGVLLEEQGEVEAARAAYQRAIDTGHPEQAARAILVLGMLLDKQGEVEAARAAYQRAIDTGHRNYAPEAMLALGLLLKEQGDVDGARAAYQRVDSDHPHSALQALVSLGVLLEERGDFEAAGRLGAEYVEAANRRAGAQSDG
jgi:Flp pilus assembly protein TadD